MVLTITRLLTTREQTVRVLVRNARPAHPAIEDLSVERVRGDLRDPASLRKALAGVSQVFHVAADYRLWTRQPAEMVQTNVDGTRNLLDAARSARVERFVYTSTVGCIGVPEGGEGNEDSPVNADEMAGPYKRSKYLAEQAALEFASQQFLVVIVNPTAPVGDQDFKPTPTGKIIWSSSPSMMVQFV